MGLNGSKWTALVGQRTHLDMYRYALRESPLLRKANTTRFVDKVPGYRENLEAVMRRAPGVPVVFVYKARASAYKSYVTHRHMDEGAFNRTWNAFMRRLDDVRRCAVINIKRCLRATSTPSTRRADACSIAWRCRFFTTRRSVIAESAPDTG